MTPESQVQDVDEVEDGERLLLQRRQVILDDLGELGSCSCNWIHGGSYNLMSSFHLN